MRWLIMSVLAGSLLACASQAVRQEGATAGARRPTMTPVASSPEASPAETDIAQELLAYAKAHVGPRRRAGRSGQELMLVLRDCASGERCADRVELFRVHYPRSVTGRDGSRIEIREVPEVAAANVLFTAAKYVAASSPDDEHGGVYEARVSRDGVEQTVCIWTTEDLAYRIDLRPDLQSGEPSPCEVAPPSGEQRENSRGQRITLVGSTSRSEPPLRDVPLESEIDDALQQIRPLLRDCSDVPRGKVRISLIIVGWLGKISDASIAGVSGAPARCLARALRFARFPLFERPRLTIIREIEL